MREDPGLERYVHLAPNCPAHGVRMVVKRSKFKEGGVWYGCPEYPTCRYKIGAHPDGRPLGTPGDQATADARKEAHEEFDRLWKGGSPIMSRAEAYDWLGRAIGEAEVHIAGCNASECRRVVALVKAYRRECHAAARAAG